MAETPSRRKLSESVIYTNPEGLMNPFYQTSGEISRRILL